MTATTLTGARDRLKVALTRHPALYDRARRPYAVGRFWLRRPHDADYAVFALFRRRRGVFLDVGANAGMSALSFRIFHPDAPILSVEPNPFHEDDLRFTARLARPLRYELCAAGARPGELTLHVPCFRGVPLTAEASLLADQVRTSTSLRRHLGAHMDTPDFTIATRRVPVRPLDELEADAAFIKLDVQGFEHEALLGLAGTIAAHRPVLLVERPSPEVDALLSGWAYVPHEFRDGQLHEGPSQRSNTVFLPA